jgi:site-specific DNA-methyltransferase (adenine-specific)
MVVVNVRADNEVFLTSNESAEIAKAIKTEQLESCSESQRSPNILIFDEEFDLGFASWSKEITSEDLAEREKQLKRIEERKVLQQNRLDYLEKQLLKDGQVQPFPVWRDGDNLISLDGRYDEYIVAKKLGLSTQMVELPFSDRDEARDYFISTTLSRTHLNEAQRCLLALKVKGPLYRKMAKENQGTRTDLKGNSQKGFASFNATKALAQMANVGEQTLSRFKVIYQDHEKNEEESYLDKDICRNYLNDLIDGKMSINQAYRKFKDAKKIKKDADEASDKEKPFGETINGSDPIGDSSDKDEFINPDLSEGIINKIICGENLEVLRQLPSESIDCVISSPDYNAPKIKYGDHVCLRPYQEYLKFLDERIAEIARVLTPTGTLILNVASVMNYYAEDRENEFNTPIFADIVLRIREMKLGLKFRTEYIWDKLSSYSKHKYISIPEDLRTFGTHEHILVFSKGSWVPKSDNPNAVRDLTPCENENMGPTVWRIAPQSTDKGNHPCPFPEKLIKRLVLRYSQRNSVVADFWLGTGTVTTVSALNGRKYFGCDFVPEYCKQAKLRTEKAVAKFQKGLEARLQSSEGDEDTMSAA